VTTRPDGDARRRADLTCLRRDWAEKYAISDDGCRAVRRDDPSTVLTEETPEALRTAIHADVDGRARAVLAAKRRAEETAAPLTRPGCRPAVRHDEREDHDDR
jgi:hypothetical protein